MAANPFLQFARGAPPAGPPPARNTDATKRSRGDGKGVIDDIDPQHAEDVPDRTIKRMKKEHQDSPTINIPVVTAGNADVKHEPCPKSQVQDEPKVSIRVEKDTNTRLALLQQLVEERRRGPPAAIDRYGTQACVFSTTARIEIQRFQLLVAALLSSQTQDAVTHAAMQRLHTQLQQLQTTEEEKEDRVTTNDGLTIAKVLTATVEQLKELLVPVGFYRRKAQQLKQVAETLHTQYHDDIPRNLTDLLALPGVGPKIARVVLLLAWDDVDEGLIVDTHVHRLANRLGWVGTPQQQQQHTKTPEQTRAKLEEWVPREYWRDFSRNVVGFGQTVCSAVYPKCGACPLAPMCPSAFKCEHPSKAKKAKTKTTTNKSILTAESTQLPLLLQYQEQDEGAEDSDDFV